VCWINIAVVSRRCTNVNVAAGGFDMQDMNGVALTLGSRVKTKSGKEAYVVSMKESSGQARVRLKSGMIRKVSSLELERF
jgi:sRNA-binding protein